MTQKAPFLGAFLFNKVRLEFLTALQEGRQTTNEIEVIQRIQRLIFEFIDSRKSSTIQELIKLTEKKTILTDLKKMFDLDAVVMDEHLIESFKPKKECNTEAT